MVLGRGNLEQDLQSRPPISQTLYRNVQRFRGGLVFKAHRLVYDSTLGLRVMKKKKISQTITLPPTPTPTLNLTHTLTRVQDLQMSPPIS